MKLRPLPALHAPYNTGPLLQGQHVKSKNVKSVAYDPDHQLLQVTFHSGATYDYLGVPQILHRQFIDAPSKGAFVREVIAPRFRSVKRPPQATIPEAK